MRSTPVFFLPQHRQGLYWRKDLGVYKPVGGPSVDEAIKAEERLQKEVIPGIREIALV
jgi:hypothetical protein